MPSFPGGSSQQASSARQHVSASKAKAGPTKVAVKTIYKDASRMRHVASELDTLVAVSGKQAALPTGALLEVKRPPRRREGNTD